MITILEGKVSCERWEKLEEAYRTRIHKIPMGLIQTFLVQDLKDREIWRIISVWRSKAYFDENTESGLLSTTCVDVFHSVGVEPTRRKFDIMAMHTQV
jgi:heme-degrading monooxygenase HmoA